jgi:hypothetical protein
VTAVVGVAPSTAFHERRAVLDAIAATLPVRFVPLDVARADDPLRDVAAVVSFGSRYFGSWRTPTLALASEGTRAAGAVHFASSTAVDHRLRERSLSSQWAPQHAFGDLRTGHEVLATVDRTAVWVREPGPVGRELVAGELPELARGEVLRDRIAPGNCLTLIALFQFLRSACSNDLWTPAGPRACIIFDDPNVRWGTYGYVDYAELIRDSRDHGYHLSFAHIPLDFRFFSRRAVQMFRAATDRVSLTIHGNNHTPTELGWQPAEEADKVVAQALRRTRRFERQTGLHVSRVMVPPHEVCSEPALQAMARLDFEGVALTQPFEWASGLNSSSPYATPNRTPAGFAPADITSFAMPMITRRGLNEHEEITIRAFLDLPVVLYGHEWDLREGPGVLHRAAAVVNQLPGVSWTDLSTLCRSNFVTRLVGTELHVRPYARRLRLAAPPTEVRSLVVHPLVENSEDRVSEYHARDGAPIRLSDRERSTLVLAEAETRVDIEIELMTKSHVDCDEVPAPPRHPRYILRRIATETRDRTHPFRDRVRKRR